MNDDTYILQDEDNYDKWTNVKINPGKTVNTKTKQAYRIE